MTDITDMDSVTVTGRLEQWMIVGPYIEGLIYGDVRSRFGDGRVVRTSRLNKIVEGLAFTQNSVYKLGAPRDRIFEPQSIPMSMKARP